MRLINGIDHIWVSAIYAARALPLVFSIAQMASVVSHSEHAAGRVLLSMPAADVLGVRRGPVQADDHSSLTPSASGIAPQSLRVNISWSFVGFATYAASQWGILALLAHLTSTDVVGHFALSMATTSPIMLLAGLELRLVQSADAERKFAFAEYLAVRLLAVGIALVCIVGIALGCGFSSAMSNVIFAVGVSKGLESVADVFYGQFQQRERMDLVAKSLILRAAASLTAFAMAILITKSLVFGIYAQSAACLLVVATYDIRSATQFLENGWENTLGFRFACDHLWKLASMALPAGLRSVLLSLENSLPHFFLSYFSGDASVGVFAALVYSLVIVQTFARSINQPAVPRLARLYIHGNRHGFSKLVRKLCLMAAIIGAAGLVCVVVAGGPFLEIAYGRQYSAHKSILVILMAACGIRLLSLPIAAALAGTNRFLWLFKIQISAVAVLSGAAGLLIPAHGLLGAACSILIAALYMLLVHGFIAAILASHLFGKIKTEGQCSTNESGSPRTVYAEFKTHERKEADRLVG